MFGTMFLPSPLQDFKLKQQSSIFAEPRESFFFFFWNEGRRAAAQISIPSANILFGSSLRLTRHQIQKGSGEGKTADSRAPLKGSQNIWMALWWPDVV